MHTTGKTMVYTCSRCGVEPSTVGSALSVNSRMVNNMTVTTMVGFTVKETSDKPYTLFKCSVSTSDIPLRSA